MRRGRVRGRKERVEREGGERIREGEKDEERGREGWEGVGERNINRTALLHSSQYSETCIKR